MLREPGHEGGELLHGNEDGAARGRARRHGVDGDEFGAALEAEGERALGLLVLELDGALAAREVAHAARTKVLPQPARDRLRVSELRHPARREGARGLDGAQQLEQVVSACAIGRDDDVETGRKRMAPVIDVHKAAEAHGSDQGRSSLQY